MMQDPQTSFKWTIIAIVVLVLGGLILLFWALHSVSSVTSHLLQTPVP